MKNWFINFFKNRIVMGIVFFSLGAFGYWGVEKVKDLRKPPVHQRLAENKFFKNYDSLFKEMEEFHNEMMKDDFWPHWRSAESDSIKLKQREDTDAVYYEIETNGKPLKNFEVKVEGHQMTISALIEEGDGKSMSSTSNMVQSFPVPSNTNADKYEVKNEPGKVIIRIPKGKA